ncbi:hypothetical protein B0H10DRAFT_338633 [Mycena sp. CBHHK59/15]|nr:hypothetical protein B0H10DRAFT_338633 [Mycena sp. CBHHK59/15]
MTKRTLAVLLLLAIIHAVHGQTLYTLSGVNPTFTLIVEGTTSLSAIGVGSDGWTTYTQSGTVSFEVAVEPSTTFTIINPSAPAMLVGEFEENASGFRFSALGLGGEHAETCAFGADGRGTCVERIVEAASTILDTFSGSVVPFYTLAAPAKDASSPLTTPPSSLTASGSSPSSTPTSSSPNGSAAKVFPITCIVISCVVGSLLYAL